VNFLKKIKGVLLMKEFSCNKCGSVELFIKENGTQTGLYCTDCGKWVKWLNKSENMLAENWIAHIKMVDKHIKIEGKLPLGLMPKNIWEEKRLQDIVSAMVRYGEAKKAIPSEWIEEYNEFRKN